MKNLIDYFNKYIKLSHISQQALLAICRASSYKKNEILQPIGHNCKTIYFLNSGIARIYYYKDGTDITEFFAFEGDILARVESLFTGQASQKAIQILEDAEVISINATALFNLYDSFPEIERLFRLIFEAGYVDTVKRIESIQFHTAHERYETLLKETAIVQKIPLKFIASYLGITQVSLSRIRAMRLG